MSGTSLEDEIQDLEERIEALRASKPAHDTTGAHDMQLLQLEDELYDIRKALAHKQAGAADGDGGHQRA